MKRIQAALEYLMTYGWAILIILVVGFALYTLGVFSPRQFTGRQVSGLSYFEVIDFKLDTDGVFLLDLGNKYGKSIVINWISADIGGTIRSGTPTNDILGPNEETDIFEMTNFPEYAAGTSYDAEVTVSFNDTKTGVEHTQIGTLSSTVES